MASRRSFHQLTVLLVYLLAIILRPFALWGNLPSEAKGFSGEGLALFPLGWSSEGRWGALIHQSVGTERETFYIQVVDAVSDEILYRSENYGTLEFSSQKDDLIRETVSAFKLEGRDAPDVRNPDFITGGASYSFFLDPPSPANERYRLRIRSSRGDVKLVYESPGSLVPERAVLLGAIISPFEDRALAIIREVPNGKSAAVYRFSGAHLIQGFSAQTVPGQDLVSAVMNGQEYVLRERLRAGSNPNAEDSRGYSVLLLAARVGNWAMIDILLDAGASPNNRDNSGRTALHHAAFAGASDAVRRLLEAGADKTIMDNAGLPARDLSADATIREMLN